MTPPGAATVRRPGTVGCAMHTTSASLLERLRRPEDREAWAQFVRLYTPLLYYWARRVGLQQHDAADLVQDVFAVLFQKLPEFTYDRGRNFRSWLRTVTLNRWRSDRRRQAGQRRADPDAHMSDLAAPDGLEVFEENEYRRQVVGRALELIECDFQPVTWKAFWEFVVVGRPAAQVAAELGLTQGAVRAAKFRIMCRLQEELAGLVD
jgi:RNA polymerase sigma-70 factor (ECF subfamily)